MINYGWPAHYSLVNKNNKRLRLFNYQGAHNPVTSVLCLYFNLHFEKHTTNNTQL